LTPYLLRGVGIAISEFNDRKADAVGRHVRGNDRGVAGAIGVEIEYFVWKDVVVGLENRAILGSRHNFELDGTSRPVSIDSVLTSLSLRVFVPDLDAHAISRCGPRTRR
jgi:hypothetical protein